MGDPIVVRLLLEPISIADWEHELTDINVGAHAWFCGVTRRKTVNGKTIRLTRTLHYEAHRSMAVTQLQQLARRAIDQFALGRVVIVHRLGEVPLGQASVLVGCNSPHRVDCFSALPWIMDRLKEDVPIWKRETFEDDSMEWIHPEPRG